MPDIGIIGSADGPTSIVVSSGLSWYEIAAIVLVVIAIGVLIARAILNYKRHK